MNTKKRKGYFCNCGTTASFNLPEFKTPIYCKKCKPVDAINARHKRCECKKARPTFNIPGEKKGRWCINCPNKPLNAINVIAKLCECGKAKPTFNIAGEKVGRWCYNCHTKPVNAINVTNKKCECNQNRPSFNLLGEKRARWCSLCKPENAIDVVHRKCECQKSVPFFNFPGEKFGKWCLSCKPADAINVLDKTCQCGIQACYNLPGFVAQYCTKCKLPGMIYAPMKKCKQCKNLAIYGQKTRQRCEEHKLENDINLVERKCIKCGLFEVLDINNICKLCNPENFIKYNQRKELHIRDVFLANNLNFISHDKIANGTICGKERPDFIFDCGTHVVIVEIDELQHKTYQCECEQTRMINIIQSFGGLKCLFIRYNPDDFKNDKGIKSLLSSNKKEEHLLDWVRLALKRIPTNLGEVVYLFFDGCNEKSSESDIVALPCI